MTVATQELDSAVALVFDQATPPPTVAARPAAAAVVETATPIDVLTHDDIQQLRTTAVCGAVVAVAVAAATQAIGGDPVARATHSAGCACGLAGCLWLLATVRDTESCRSWHALALGLVGAVTTISGFYFWGLFSAVTIAVPAVALLLAQSRQSRGIWLIATAYLGGHQALALLVIFGVVEDRGLTKIGEHSTATHLGRLLLVQMLMLGAFVVARHIRRTHRDSVRQLDEVLRALAQRDALLQELDVERAGARRLDAPGRYTGQTLGSYRLGPVIGGGANGVVYDAQHVESGKAAAVKLLHPHLLAHPAQYRRFAREVRIASSLRSPHVARVLELPSSGDSFPYLAMERLRGCSLADYLVTHPALPLDQVVELVLQVGHGLQTAHRAGIVHRDLEPRNVFRLEPAIRGVRWKVLDFGTSKNVMADEGSLTDFGHVVGTPAYMAPEQAAGNKIDYRADIHALGVLAYRALTGHPPFASREIPQLLRQVVYASPVRPGALRPLPPDVDRALAIALAKRPYERYGNAAELGDALAAAACNGLSDSLRSHADRLVADRPWARPARHHPPRTP